MAKNDIGGVWRTIGGRRVFIKDGQDLASAMRESGKFKTAKKFSKREELKKDIAHQVTEAEKNGNTAHAEIGKRELERLNNEEKEQAVKDYENGKISADEVLNKFYGQEDKMKETFEQMGYTAPTKENIDKANTRHEEFMKDLKNKDIEKDSKAKMTTPLGKEDDTAKLPYEKGEKYRNSITETAKNSKEDRMAGVKEQDERIKKSYEEAKKMGMSNEQATASALKQEKDYQALKETEKSTNDIMNEKIRSRGKSKVEEEDLPKRTEIKTQGTSNRKEVSENIQAHILDYYTEDYTGEKISPSEAFVRQMDAMGESNMWRAGQKIAEGGSYLIYNSDMADFLNELKINPKGKTFSDQKAFEMYTSLVGRESAKLYERIQKNSYNKYLKAHPLSKMSFEEFKEMNKK